MRVLQELKNLTTEDLIFKFDNESFLIKAGAEELMYQEVAQMGAKRLTDRECSHDPLNKIKKQKMFASFLGEVRDNRVQPGATTLKAEMEKEVAEVKKKEVEKPKTEEKEFEELDEFVEIKKDEPVEKPKKITRVKNAVIGKGRRKKGLKKGDK